MAKNIATGLVITEDEKVGTASSIPNAFGLEAITSCPGFTAFSGQTCFRCYSDASELRRDNVKTAMRENFDILASIEFSRNLTDDQKISKMEGLLFTAIEQEFRSKLTARDRSLTREQRATLKSQISHIFRWHWDGDFFAVNYAKAAFKVMNRMPDIQFWLYTRSIGFRISQVEEDRLFTEREQGIKSSDDDETRSRLPKRPAVKGKVDILPVFFTSSGRPRLSNVSFYISTDNANVSRVKQILSRKNPPQLNIASCASTEGEALNILSILKRGRGKTVCPEITGDIPLSVDMFGACAQCRLCVVGRADIMFVTFKANRIEKKLITSVAILKETVKARLANPKIIKLMLRASLRTRIVLEDKNIATIEKMVLATLKRTIWNDLAISPIVDRKTRGGVVVLTRQEELDAKRATRRIMREAIDDLGITIKGKFGPLTEIGRCHEIELGQVAEPEIPKKFLEEIISDSNKNMAKLIARNGWLNI